jgi:muramoyltetrapeptide carboxypeptidase
MVEHFRSRCDVPILIGLPFGHVREKVTLPVGQKAQLSVRGEAGFELVVRTIDCG